MKVIYARLFFTDELLGSAAADPEIHRKFIASKAPDAETLEEEVAAVGVDEAVENRTSVFARDPETGKVNIWAYHLKGQFKSACGALRTVEKPAKKDDEPKEEGAKKKKNPAYECGKITNYKSKIDTLIQVWPKRIMLHLPDEKEDEKQAIGNCQRPLRANTPQGERVALANSESVPEGTWCDVQIMLIDDSHEKFIRECLDFGIFYGLGQWRNSGKGRFRWQELDGPGGNPIETTNRFLMPFME